MFGVRISLPKMPISVKPRSSAMMMRKFGRSGAAAGSELTPSTATGAVSLPQAANRRQRLKTLLIFTGYLRVLNKSGANGTRNEQTDGPELPDRRFHAYAECG